MGFRTPSSSNVVDSCLGPTPRSAAVALDVSLGIGRCFAVVEVAVTLPFEVLVILLLYAWSAVISKVLQGSSAAVRGLGIGFPSTVLVVLCVGTVFTRGSSSSRTAPTPQVGLALGMGIGTVGRSGNALCAGVTDTADLPQRVIVLDEASPGNAQVIARQDGIGG